MRSLGKLRRYGGNSRKTMDEYPERLLPHNNYVVRMDRSGLTEIDPYLQRKSFLPIEECCVEGNQDCVTTRAFGQSGLYNMSVNILGGLFEVGDEKWHQAVGKEDEWNGGDVDIRKYKERYESRDVTASVYFKFRIADGLKWTFPRRFNTIQERNSYEKAIEGGLSDSETFVKTVDYLLKTHSECHHSPNMLNYWHMEIKTIIDRKPEEVVDANDKKYQKKAVRGMIEVLRPHCTLRPPHDSPILPEDVYKKV